LREVLVEKERRDLLEAALEEFSEVGLTASSLESIAERADLEPSVARALFVDKQRLLGAVLRESTEPLVSAIGMAVEKVEDPRELMYKSLRLLDQWLLDNPKYVRLFQHGALEKASTIESLYQHSFFPSEFYERVQEYLDRGEIRGGDAFTVFLLLDSLIFFSHMMRPALELMCSIETSEQLFERRFDAIMDVLEHGLYSTPE
jgi:AcrR family transcriptional regulator